ncbi:MAG: SPOR domain-containing protein [Legionellaceae bacterium]|nr:SPOR domain-containing protein [Legionellaceae bacterium]
MANYPEQRRKRKPRSTTSRVPWVILGFVLGYAFSWFCNPVLVISWLKIHLGHPAVVEDSGVDVAALPKPKFEFYTLLTQEKTEPPKKTPSEIAKTASVSAPAASAPASPAVADTVNINPHQTYYVLQLASFQRREDAEQMLAGLVMRGIEANIKTITQQGAAWHRVVVGPFASKTQAEKAQGAIAHSERVSGIIRRMES